MVPLTEPKFGPEPVPSDLGALCQVGETVEDMTILACRRDKEARALAAHTITIWSDMEDMALGAPVPVFVAVDSAGMFHFDPACTPTTQPTRTYLRDVVLPPSVCTNCKVPHPVVPAPFSAQWQAWALDITELITHHRLGSFTQRVFEAKLWVLLTCIPNTDTATLRLLAVAMDMVCAVPGMDLELVLFTSAWSSRSTPCPLTGRPTRGNSGQYMSDRALHTSEIIRGMAAGFVLPVAAVGKASLSVPHDFITALPSRVLPDLEKVCYGEITRYGRVDDLNIARILSESAIHTRPDNFEQLLLSASQI